MGLLDQTNVPTLLTPSRSSGSHCTQGLLGRRFSTDGCEKEEHSCCHQGSNPNRTTRKEPQYRLHTPVHFSYTRLLFIAIKILNILSMNKKKHTNTSNYKV